MFKRMREDGERIFAWVSGDGSRHLCWGFTEAQHLHKSKETLERRLEDFPDRVDLQVPYAEKDQAKNKGARWDAEARVWYVPPGTNPRKFARWMTDDLPGAFERMKHEAHEHMRAICSGR